ncbi:pyridoxamine 5'-phosphate oxidase family protein [Fodinicola feengrottensis]|uniref:pyridoxamine 5'-phosphate oxidase family protein n=1 Tax=Fodinicola feengrottensis TaxID=435914 RepID=UPI002441EE8D|nr:pyridoxamine 5'-phosphate oxidase family protein [Fodinicola feengrottensis]
MTAWRDVEAAEPEFARRVRALFDAHKHKTIATLRADGSPRISGIETVFEAGELGFGSMPKARKGADLRRDPRFALHSSTRRPGRGRRGAVAGRGENRRAGDRRRTGRRQLPRRHRRSRPHPPQRNGHAARGRVVDTRRRTPKSRPRLGDTP